MDLSKIKKIYMIGIKGVGMTMLAQFLAGKGIEITGSDTEEKFMTDEVLKKAGIKVIEKFAANNVPNDVDLIIYSTAYNKDNNVEVAKALEGSKKVLTYAEALGEVFNEKYGIAVVGTHGKTTVSAWLGFVLEQAGLQPNVMVGARVPQFNGTSLVGTSDYLVAELDEYQNKLKHFQPQAVLLNNIEYDHPDFFSSKDEYKQVFIEFIKKIPKDGFLIANWDDPEIRSVANVNCKGKVITYALNEVADYVVYDIKQDGGKQYFKVHLTPNPSPSEGEGDNDNGNEELGDFSIQLAGKHNVANALAVIAACIELDVELVDIRKYLEDFKGTARRMEVMGEFRGATIIDDYAHHPTEIKATLEAVRQLYPNNKLRVVFHPHTFTRTKALLDDFAKSFSKADEVVVLDIYGSAREEHGGVSSEDLVNLIKHENTPLHQGYEGQAKTRKHENTEQRTAKYISTLGECEKYLRENVERGDVLLLMGAGDVFRIGENLVRE